MSAWEREAPRRAPVAAVSAPQRLYGLPAAERLFRTIAEVFTHDVEPWDDDDGKPWTVEEFTVLPAGAHLPEVESLLDWIAEWAGEMGQLDSDGAEAFRDAARHPDARKAAATLLEVIAGHVSYRMASERVATHTLTVVDGRPHLDGEPLLIEQGAS